MEGQRSFSDILCNNLRVRVYFSTCLRELWVLCLSHFRGIMPGPFHGCYRKKARNRFCDSYIFSRKHFQVDKKQVGPVRFLFCENHRTKAGFARHHTGTKHRCPRTARFVADPWGSMALYLTWNIFFSNALPAKVLFDSIVFGFVARQF